MFDLWPFRWHRSTCSHAAGEFNNCKLFGFRPIFFLLKHIYSTILSSPYPSLLLLLLMFSGHKWFMSADSYFLPLTLRRTRLQWIVNLIKYKGRAWKATVLQSVCCVGAFKAVCRRSVFCLTSQVRRLWFICKWGGQNIGNTTTHYDFESGN